MRAYKLILILLLLGLMEVGCGSSSLTRDRAARLLRESHYFQAPRCATVHLGRVYGNLNGFTDNEAVIRVLRSANLVRVGRVPSTIIGTDAMVTLTPAGDRFFRGLEAKQYPSAADSSSWELPLAAREFLAVTGIVVDGKTARVEFTYREVPTPLGELLLAASKAGNPSLLPLPAQREVGEAALFRLYDDGWRLVRIVD